MAAAICCALGLGTSASAETKRWFEGSDKVFIRQHEQFVRIQEPDVHLKRARRAYVKGHASTTADELEKAAAGMAYFAERTAGASRKEFSDASRGLNELADQARRREIGEITILDRAIADAMRILAGEPKPAAAQ